MKPSQENPGEDTFIDKRRSLCNAITQPLLDYTYNVWYPKKNIN